MIESLTFGQLLDSKEEWIDPDLQNLLPRNNTPTEDGIGYLDQLEQNLLQDKDFNNSFIFNKRPDGSLVLLDGYTRLNILEKHQDEFDLTKPVQFKIKNLKYKAEEMSWMLANNRGRRTLSTHARTLILGEVYESVKLSQGYNKQSGQTGHGVQSVLSDIAKENGLSERTLRRNGKLVRSLRKLAKLRKKEPNHFYYLYSDNILSQENINDLADLKNEQTILSILKEASSESMKRKLTEALRLQVTTNIASDAAEVEQKPTIVLEDASDEEIMPSTNNPMETHDSTPEIAINEVRENYEIYGIGYLLTEKERLLRKVEFINQVLLEEFQALSPDKQIYLLGINSKNA